MKFNKILYISGLLMCTPLIATTVENNQIMPPPGPYKSIMNNTPPVFIPYGSQQAPANPYKHGASTQAFNRFPVQNQTLQKPAIQAPEWVLSKQQENKEKIEKMLKENEIRNKENEKRFREHLKKAEELSIKRNEESKKWIAENNKKMKEFWQSELDKFAKNQKLQIEKAKDLPEWVRKDMLQQQQKQLAVMKNNPPLPMNNTMQNSSQSVNRFNNMRQISPVNQMPPANQVPQVNQRPQIDQRARANMMQRNNQFIQPQVRPQRAMRSLPWPQHGKNSVMPQQPAQPFYNVPQTNRGFTPAPMQRPYPGNINGQSNVNPYNRYTR